MLSVFIEGSWFSQHQLQCVSDAELPCPVCRSHRSRSLGFVATCATNIPKYLVWLYTSSFISSAGVTRCLSIYLHTGYRPVSRVLSVLIEGSWLSQHQLQCVSRQRYRIASGWYTKLRQVASSAVGVGDINRRLCDLQGHRYCK